LAWFYLAVVVLYSRNPYRLYNPSILKWVWIAVPVVFVGLAWGLTRQVRPRLTGLTRHDWLALGIISLLVSGLVIYLFPPLNPALPTSHQIRLTTLAEHNPASKGGAITIERIRSVAGPEIPFKELNLTGDWKISAGRLVSDGSQSGSTVVYRGSFPAGVVLKVPFTPRSGRLKVQLDGQNLEADLFSNPEKSGYVILNPPVWGMYSPIQKALVGFGFLLYAFGVISLTFGLGLILRLRLLPSWAEWGVIGLLCVLFLGIYLNLKFEMADTNVPRIYNDTESYVLAAQEPLNSVRFWFSERTFTLPLFYKLIGVTPQNYRDNALLRNMAYGQAWISAFCWAFLALAAAIAIRSKWLKPVAFLVVLFFSLSFEIALWDWLMLSESLSFSLFAVLTALWLWMVSRPLGRTGSSLLMAALLIVSVLFSFTRDTNLYLLLAAAGVFLLAWLWRRIDLPNRRLVLVYSILILGLFVFQNLTLRVGNRWQVHIYDNLMLRALQDPQMLDYFKQAGLPLTDDFLRLQDQGIVHYNIAQTLSDRPGVRPVLEWVNRSGSGVYAGWLLTHPQRSIWTPLAAWQVWLNGSSAEYRQPFYPDQAISKSLTQIDERVYPRAGIVLVVFTAILAAGMLASWLARKGIGGVWLVLTVFVVSIPPLAILIWNANPLEIERHSLQIGVQFRLAGWLGLLLLLDGLAARLLWPDRAGAGG
jgi:hypothetical protein